MSTLTKEVKTDVDTDVSSVEKLMADVANRAVKTFMQAGTSAAAVQWAAAGLGKGHVVDFSSVERTVTSVIVAGGAAGVSAVWNLVKGYFTAKNATKVSAVVEAQVGPVAKQTETDVVKAVEDVLPMHAGSDTAGSAAK